VTAVDPELLEQLAAVPFMTVEDGDTVILAIQPPWTMEQVAALGTYLMEWAPLVKWQALHEPGFSGVIHVKATPSTT
jgi:hypothetical protein